MGKREGMILAVALQKKGEGRSSTRRADKATEHAKNRSGSLVPTAQIAQSFCQNSTPSQREDVLW